VGEDADCSGEGAAGDERRDEGVPADDVGEGVGQDRQEED